MERNSFLIVSKEVLANKRIPATAKLLFAQLCDHRNKRTGQCNPKQATLARAIGVSLDTVQRELARLSAEGLIAVSRTQYGCNYILQIPQNAVSQTAKCGFPKPQNAVSGPSASLLTEPYLKNLGAARRSRPQNIPRKTVQSEVLESYYREERRKAGKS